MPDEQEQQPPTIPQYGAPKPPGIPHAGTVNKVMGEKLGRMLRPKLYIKGEVHISHGQRGMKRKQPKFY